MKTLFYRCPICGNIILKVQDSGVVPSCCGKPMELLHPQTEPSSAGITEHHAPVVTPLENHCFRVNVGEKPHPMTSDHFIRLICLECEHSVSIRYLGPECQASSLFCCPRDQPVAAYALCNIHGLWRTEIPMSF